MRYDLTETHIAGIAAGVLAIVIIAGAVALAMSVTQPSPAGNATDSATPSPMITSTADTQSEITVTAEPTPTESTPTPTPTPTSTPTPTPTPTATSTPPPTETVNKGINPGKVSVEPLCTNYREDTAQYQLKNKNAQPATIVYSSTAGNSNGGEVTIEGGSSVDVRIPTSAGTSGGNSTALTVGLPGTNNGTHSGATYNNAATPCNSKSVSSPSVTFTNQTSSDGHTVEIKRSSLPKGGFVALYTKDGSLVSSSNYIGPGTANSVEISVDRGIQGNVSLVAQLHYDTNGDGTFDSADEAYTKNGVPISDTATVKSS